MTRKEAKIATAQKVLEAARAEFLEVGYEAATIRSIATRAGTSTGAVFANHPDKAHLMRAAFGDSTAAAMRIADTAATTMVAGGWAAVPKPLQDEAVIAARMLAALLAGEF